MSQSILTVGPTGAATRYSSLRAVSRVLSGDGSDSARRTIARRVNDGGGFVGEVWVQGSAIPGVRRPRS